MATRTAELRLSARSPEHHEALARVRDWTRERFKLAHTATILVAEIACGLPGCPPLETVVAFWTEAEKRHQFKVFKPVRDIVTADLPFAWLKDSLFVPKGFGCDCC
jgi:hypothetical protein